MNTWHEKIQDELDKRTSICQKKYGLFDEYVHPPISPFSYPNVKFPSERVVDYMNKLENAYIRATTQIQCENLGGMWDKNSVSREDKYSRGVCWATENDKKCANAVDPTVFRPHEMKQISAEERAEIISNAKEMCNKCGANCKFARIGQHTYDCFADNRHIEEESQINAAALETEGNRCQLFEDPLIPIENVTPARKMLSQLQDKIKTSHSIEKFESLTTPELFSKLKRSKSINNLHEREKYFPEIFSEWPTHLDDLTDIPVNRQKQLVSQGQLSVYNIVKNNPDQRGLIIWHSTGSGKTCIASGIMTQYWDTPRQILYVSSIPALASNPPEAFATCATKFWPNFQNNLQFLSANRVQFITYTTLINALHRKPSDTKTKKLVVDFNNSVLIFDEVQNLFMPISNQAGKHDRLFKELIDPQKWPKLKIYILTATPGSNANELISILNFVRDPNSRPIKEPNESNEEEFRQQIKNLVSFFDMSNDKSAFPVLIDNHIIRSPMSPAQFQQYLLKTSEVNEANKNFEKLAKENKSNNYWKIARKYSNMMLNLAPRQPLAEFSSKLPALLDNIQKYPNEKHFVYSSFWENYGYGGQGILAIADQLKKLGYSQMISVNKQSKRQFILALQPDKKNFSNLVSLFNSPENSHGQIIHIFLASKTFNEGLDLKDVRHIHVFEPLVTWAGDRQLIGRAVRYCSHANLNKDSEWTVHVHRYLAEKPEGAPISFVSNQNQKMNVGELKMALSQRGISFPPKTKKMQLEFLLAQAPHDIGDIEMIDAKIFRESKDRAKKLLRLYQLIKESAVDCQQFSQYHNIKCWQK